MDSTQISADPWCILPEKSELFKLLYNKTIYNVYSALFNADWIKTETVITCRACHNNTFL